MKALVQRVIWAEVRVKGSVVGRIEQGLLVFLGIARGDCLSQVDTLVDKIANLRIFPNEEGRFDRSVRDVEGSILAVSQFTLLGDCSKGRRPNFQAAAPPETAEPLYQAFIEKLKETGILTATGIFQAHMEVVSVNDGPVTLMIDMPPQLSVSQERS